MSLTMWFREDLARVLLAGVVLAIEGAQAQGCTNVEHVNGILAMAKHQALAVGVAWPELVRDAHQALGDDLARLLDGATRALPLEHE